MTEEVWTAELGMSTFWSFKKTFAKPCVREKGETDVSPREAGDQRRQGTAPANTHLTTGQLGRRRRSNPPWHPAAAPGPAGPPSLGAGAQTHRPATMAQAAASKEGSRKPELKKWRD